MTNWSFRRRQRSDGRLEDGQPPRRIIIQRSASFITACLSPNPPSTFCRLPIKIANKLLLLLYPSALLNQNPTSEDLLSEAEKSVLISAGRGFDHVITVACHLAANASDITCSVVFPLSEECLSTETVKQLNHLSQRP